MKNASLGQRGGDARAFNVLAAAIDNSIGQRYVFQGSDGGDLRDDNQQEP